jgi:hypothetical protein
MLNKNLGYYRCGGIDFQSKVSALLHSRVINQPVEWMFHQDVFELYPWHIEPAETLDQLYDRRARELREKYDYIIISYSGGADSNNIIESFIRQNLHIDEILINHLSRATQSTTVLDPKIKDSWNFAAEYQLQAVPRLQEIYNRLPNTKIIELEVSDTVIDTLKNYSDADWVLNHSDMLSVGQTFRYNYFHFGHIKEKFDRGQQVGIVVGIDKPNTFIKNNKFYLRFVDTVANITGINDFNSDYTNVTTEFFYWSPESLSMICKQAHVIKQWVEANPQRRKFWDKPSVSTVRLYHERWLRKILYTTWDNNWFQADKATSWWNTEFDTWFRTNPDFAQQFHVWKSGVGHLAQRIPDFVDYNKYGQVDKLRTFYKEYYVGPVIADK